MVGVFTIPQDSLAQSHVVSPAELQSATVASTQVRQNNIETIQQFVSSPTAEKALKSAHMDSKQVKDAVSRLSDQELAQLAARSSKAQTDFAAGTLSNRDLIIILVCIAALILIIVAVH
jgi:CHASE3 domain sensor protein